VSITHVGVYFTHVGVSSTRAGVSITSNVCPTLANNVFDTGQADALGTRIGIMVAGQLSCLGTAQVLIIHRPYDRQYRRDIGGFLRIR